MTPGRDVHPSSRDSFLTKHRRTTAVFWGSFSSEKSVNVFTLEPPHHFTLHLVNCQENGIEFPSPPLSPERKWQISTSSRLEEATRAGHASVASAQEIGGTHYSVTQRIVCFQHSAMCPACARQFRGIFFSLLVSFFLEVDEVLKLSSNQATRTCNLPHPSFFFRFSCPSEDFFWRNSVRQGHSYISCLMPILARQSPLCF